MIRYPTLEEFRNPATARQSFKHYDNGNGYEFCSGRPGFSRRKTSEKSEVTCKNCLRAIAKAEQS